MIKAEDRKQMLDRLARIEGQIRGVQKLIRSGEEDCEKVLQQVSAARKALDKSAHAMLACVAEEYVTTDKAVDRPDLSALISKYA